MICAIHFLSCQPQRKSAGLGLNLINNKLPKVITRFRMISPFQNHTTSLLKTYNYDEKPSPENVTLDS